MNYTSLICGHVITFIYGYLDAGGGSFYQLAWLTLFFPNDKQLKQEIKNMQSNTHSQFSTKDDTKKTNTKQEDNWWQAATILALNWLAVD